MSYPIDLGLNKSTFSTNFFGLPRISTQSCLVPKTTGWTCFVSNVITSSSTSSTPCNPGFVMFSERWSTLYHDLQPTLNNIVLPHFFCSKANETCSSIQLQSHLKMFCHILYKRMHLSVRDINAHTRPISNFILKLRRERLNRHIFKRKNCHALR